MLRHFLAIAFGVLFLQGCLTLSENAPPELHAAKSSLDAAYDKDVDDFLPVTMDKAQSAFDEALEAYRDSEDYQGYNRLEMAKAARDQSIIKANESKRLSGSALSLYTDLLGWDRNIESYTQLKSESAEIAAMRVQIQNLQNAGGEISDDFLIVKPVAFFQTDSADVTKSVVDDVERLIFLLNRHPALFVELRGYADYRGGELYNKQLGMQRARAVAKMLREHGVSDERIKLLSVGEELAFSDADDPARLQLDRRVEAKLTVLSH